MVTMATSTLDTELTCSICLEFYKDPYQLPCMHSFCKQCLIEFSKPKITSEDDDGCSKGAAKPTPDKDENVLECPECRHIATLDDKGIDGLPKNFTLANIVKKYAKQEDKEEKKYPCDICDTEPPRDAVKCCLQCGILYCNGCLSQVHPSKGKLKTHKLVEPSQHQYSDSISPEDSKFIDSLLLSVNNLDILKRRYERKMKDIQKNIDSLQDSGGRRKKETNMVFDRLCTMLKSKEQQCISEVDEEVDGKTDNLVLLLASCRQYTEDINKLMKDAKASVEDFPRKTTRSDLQIIQNRISEFEKKQVDFQQETLTSACGLVDTYEIEDKLANLGQSDGSGTKNHGHIWNVNVKFVPVRTGATISVTWNKIPGKDIYYDISAECILPSGIRERFLYSGISGCQYKIGNLRPETSYQICVAVQGEINLKNNGVRIQTLKCIHCESFILNGECAHDITFVSEDSKTMMPRNVAKEHPPNYKRVQGTTGTIEISSGNLYWECKIWFSFPRGMKTYEYVFDIGICQKTVVDRIAGFHKNYGAYSTIIIKYGNKDIKLEFNREGEEVVGNKVDIAWQNQMHLHLGFYIDIEKGTFSVINVIENYTLFSFNNIKKNVPYVPIFTHCDNDRKLFLDIRLLSGQDIQEIPSCLLKLLK